MDERFKTLALHELLPRIVRELKEKHRECARQYDVFFDSMMDVFAGRFTENPEATLDRFLRLSDEDCAWEKGDFRTRDTLLDNFIGREIARTLRGELEEYGYFDADLWFVTWDDMEGVQRLRERNQELGKLVREKEGELARLMVDNEKLLRKNHELMELLKQDPVKQLMEKNERIDELRAELMELRDEHTNLEEHSAAVELGVKAKHYAQLCSILGVCVGQGGVTPAYVARATGIHRDLVYDLLAELVELGLVRKLGRGYYEPSAAEVDARKLELMVALRRVRHWSSG